jgi:hypothetical protein
MFEWIRHKWNVLRTLLLVLSLSPDKRQVFLARAYEVVEEGGRR